MLIKKIAGLLVILLLSACTEAESPTSVERKNKMKDNPETRAMLAAFKQQKHRLEFNRCELLYNGTPFRLGMTVKELEGIFGPYDFFSKGSYSWKEVGIMFGGGIKSREDKNIKVKLANIFMSGFEENINDGLYHKKDYFLLEGMPVDKNMQFRDFIKNSYFYLDDFSISDSSYTWKVKCDDSGKNLKYGMYVKGGWNYAGSGHIRLKSDPNIDNVNVIEALYIIEKSEK